MSRNMLQILLVVVVLILGAGATAALILSRQAPETVERPTRGPLVEARTVTTETVRADIAGQGEVRARRSVQLAPQVTGRVVATHPSLVAGGRMRAGETLLRIDPRDFELAVERARAAVARSATTIEREQAEADAAVAEWREMQGDAEAPPLLARKPQIAQARAELAAAEADLATAKLNLGRTRLDVPFDGMVVEESVEVGQLVTAGQSVATLYGTDRVEVRVPLADRELAWIEMPTGQDGPPAEVRVDFAGGDHSWSGTATRLESQVDARSRMVQLVVEVPRPFDPADDRPPLMPGTFADVVIEGKTLEDVIVIPRFALRADDMVWVVDDGTLSIRPVEVLRADRDRVYLGRGLSSGERIIVSSLDAVTEGMAVRVAEDEVDVATTDPPERFEDRPGAGPVDVTSASVGDSAGEVTAAEGADR